MSDSIALYGSLQDLNLLSITVRLLLAFVISAVIGLERGANKHQAGMRTHILVCLGATVAMLTNEYISLTMTGSDPSRFGGQVISGIGFLGAGLILVTTRNKVKGLTTAAGLWASACIGLALGIGFYSGALITAALVFIALALLPALEDHFYRRSSVVDFYGELESADSVKSFLEELRKGPFRILESHVSHSSSIIPDGYRLTVSLRLLHKTESRAALDDLEQLPGIFYIEEY